MVGLGIMFFDVSIIIIVINIKININYDVSQLGLVMPFISLNPISTRWS